MGVIQAERVRTLSDDQLQFWDDNGLLILKAAVSREQIDACWISLTSSGRTEPATTIS